MRKLIAILLSIVLLLSGTMISIIFVSASENVSLDYTKVSFDGDSAKFYEGTNEYAYVDYENSGNAEHGKAIKFTTIANSWGDSWPQAFRIGQTDGSGAFYVEEGATYKISYQYMNERATSARSHIISVIPDTQLVTQLGKLQTRMDAGTAFSVGWVDSGNSKEWKTYNATFVAPCDGTLAFSIIRGDNKSVKYQKIWFDNFVIEKVVSYDGSTVDVTYDYNDGSAVESETRYVGHSYGYPTREGYVFDGWYTDATCTIEAPTTVRPSCTKVYAKWSVDNRVPQHITNTYDEEGITYTPGATLTQDSYNKFKEEHPDGSPTYATMYDVNLYTGKEVGNWSLTEDANALGGKYLNYVKANTGANGDLTNYIFVANPTGDFATDGNHIVLSEGTTYNMTVRYKISDLSEGYNLNLFTFATSGVATPNNTSNYQHRVNVKLGLGNTDGWVEETYSFKTPDTYTGTSIHSLVQYKHSSELLLK